MASDEDVRTKTIEESAFLSESQEEGLPGLVVVFSEGRPKSQALRLDKTVELGRVPGDGVFMIEDDRVSRHHTRITLRDGGVVIKDLESRNGTFVDGRRIGEEMFSKPPRVLRVGQTLMIFVPDVRPFLRAPVKIQGDSVIGPRLLQSRERIARAALSGDTLLLTGPSGSGKELAARAFHASAGRVDGPFVAVNCAAIPTGLAERLLFGARKGAYSGANADAEGYVQAADKGTLFLDEVAELDINVQPKLLRVLEMREVLALGSAHPRKVDVKVVAATLKDLRAEVTAGRFREDLYYRIGQPEVRLPSLLERAEEIPWLTTFELAKIDSKLTAGSLFIEACLCRSWPGNVREFLGEVRQAARAALDADRTVVEPKDLSPKAGMDIANETVPMNSSEVSKETIEAALKREQGNVTRAARSLGMHRNQLRRWLSRNNVDPKSFGSAGDGDG